MKPASGMMLTALGASMLLAGCGAPEGDGKGLYGRAIINCAAIR